LAESTLSTFVASDGENIAIQDWPLEPGQAVRGMVLIVHGLAEHAGRYDALARRLNDWGFAVRGYDQYGHGESGGVRGGLPSDNRFLDDLTDVMDSTRARLKPGTPLILLGHSMGGLVAARFVSLSLRPVEGLVLSSPALDAGLGFWTRLLLRIMLACAPDFALSRNQDPSELTHDPQAVQAFRDDRLIHRSMTARLAQFIVRNGQATLACAGNWRVPTLLLYAGTDLRVNPQGSLRFVQAAPKAIVSAQCFDAMYHEVFNELEREQVLGHLKAWLDARY
jgi:alpha-beta hydrolase superfamily lysophospholipase